MKINYIFLLIITIVVSLLGGCTKFLDVPYDNRISLDDLDDFEGLAVNAYPLRADMFTEIMTDNLHHYASTMQANNAATYVPLYKWEDEFSDAIAVAQPNHAYTHYYSKIYEANTIIEEIGSATGDQNRKKALLGEALILRAYGYFSLVNLFSMHYDEVNNATNLGVPLILEVPKENRPLYNRATVKEVYDQIDKDVAEGLALMQEGSEFAPRTAYRFNLASIYAFMTRINFYKGKWEETVRYADLVVGQKGVTVRKMSEDNLRRTTTTEQFWAQEIMNPSLHPNLLLVNQTNLFLCRPFGYRLGGFYVAHDIFYGTPNIDFRRAQFIAGGTVIDSVALPVKYANQPNNPNAAQARYDMFTMEEVLLSRAEANLRIQTPDITKAMADIEAIRRERFTVANYRALPTPATSAEAIDAVLRERRLELLGQGLRWYDIKRLRLRVEHRLVRTSRNPDVVLEPNDPRTALQIPINARIGNPLLENQLNPR